MSEHGSIEIEHLDHSWGTEPRRLYAAGGDLIVTVKDLGQGISIIANNDERWLQVMAHLARLPRELWWEEIVDAWYERRLPCLWRVRMTVMEDAPAPQFLRGEP